MLDAGMLATVTIAVMVKTAFMYSVGALAIATVAATDKTALM